ncbi:hypothetical protein BFZC1_01487 [Lysinibacillus fusiformis ZC1]|nr:hypothetical protein BFZC1_01487 [Lysinibacillus fusiformis ZC1]EKU41678.1 hypothetical protein C518_3341 [Lysinibacillus fusiformis ZB2]
MYSKAPYSYSFKNICYSEVKHQMGVLKSADLGGVPKMRHPL